MVTPVIYTMSTTHSDSAAEHDLRLPARLATVCLISRFKRSGPGRHYGALLNGRLVLELQKQEGVRAISVEDFAAKHAIVVEREIRGGEARAALARARTASQRFRRYRFLDGNCEHFARYVVEGLRKSDQISDVLVWCILVAFVFASRG